MNAYNLNECCVFEFPEENNKILMGYQSFIEDEYEKPLKPDSEMLYTISWPEGMSEICPPKRMVAATKNVKWNCYPARVIASGTFMQMKKHFEELISKPASSKEDRKEISKKPPEPGFEKPDEKKKPPSRRAEGKSNKPSASTEDAKQKVDASKDKKKKTNKQHDKQLFDKIVQKINTDSVTDINHSDSVQMNKDDEEKMDEAAAVSATGDLVVSSKGGKKPGDNKKGDKEKMDETAAVSAIDGLVVSTKDDKKADDNKKGEKEKMDEAAAAFAMDDLVVSSEDDNKSDDKKIDEKEKMESPAVSATDDLIILNSSKDDKKPDDNLKTPVSRKRCNDFANPGAKKFLPIELERTGSSSEEECNKDFRKLSELTKQELINRIKNLEKILALERKELKNYKFAFAIFEDLDELKITLEKAKKILEGMQEMQGSSSADSSRTLKKSHKSRTTYTDIKLKPAEGEKVKPITEYGIAERKLDLARRHCPRKLIADLIDCLFSPEEQGTYTITGEGIDKTAFPLPVFKSIAAYVWHYHPNCSQDVIKTAVKQKLNSRSKNKKHNKETNDTDRGKSRSKSSKHKHRKSRSRSASNKSTKSRSTPKDNRDRSRSRHRTKRSSSRESSS